MKPLPTQTRLKELLFYDPTTGDLIWKARSSSASRAVLGAIAGSPSPKGYMQTMVDTRLSLNHHLVWIYNNHTIPTGKFIDHINHVVNDNRLENLRPASRQENMQNRSKHKGCTSPFVGVYWQNVYCKWAAQGINIDGKQRHLGFFDDEILAARLVEREMREVKGEFFNEKTSVDYIINNKLKGILNE